MSDKHSDDCRCEECLLRAEAKDHLVPDSLSKLEAKVEVQGHEVQLKVDVKRRHPAAIIFNIILEGQAVLINGEEWRYQDGIFGIRREKWTDGVRQEDILLSIDMTVGDFIKWCEKLPEETIIQAVFASVIGKERIRKY